MSFRVTSLLSIVTGLKPLQNATQISTPSYLMNEAPRRNGRRSRERKEAAGQQHADLVTASWTACCIVGTSSPSVGTASV
jgi:hypothetical protein